MISKIKHETDKIVPETRTDKKWVLAQKGILIAWREIISSFLIIWFLLDFEVSGEGLG